MDICDIKSRTPVSSIRSLVNYDFSHMEDGSIVYICGTAMPDFMRRKFRTLDCRIILVTGDCDWEMPNDVFPVYKDFIDFIESDNIIHWYSQNGTVDHPKFTRIPIGLDYHTLETQDHEWGLKISPIIQERQLNELNTTHYTQRGIMCYANFHFTMNTRYAQDRKDAIESIPKMLVMYEPTKIPRYETWKKQSKYAFVISPHGNGLDCHRTWEALCLGCIPIVKSSNLNSLFEDLPVLIVEKWSDININLLVGTLKSFASREFNFHRLSLNYWHGLITAKALFSL